MSFSGAMQSSNLFRETDRIALRQSQDFHFIFSNFSGEVDMSKYPERRITHAAITENKRLGALLSHIKDQQDKAPLTVKVKPVSAKNGYQKTGRRPLDVPRRWTPIAPENAQTEKPAQPARAPMCEVYALSGCATVCACGDISALHSR